MPNDKDKDARKKRAERLQKQIDDATAGKRKPGKTPREITDAAAAEAKRRAEEKKDAPGPGDPPPSGE